MKRNIGVVLLGLIVAAMIVLPSSGSLLEPDAALAASGATFPAPPNYNFEAGPLEVGTGPTNYDFSDGGTGWTKSGTGSVTYSDGVATLSGSVLLTSSTYTLTNDLQAVKVRYKAGAAASVSVLKSGVSVGSDNLSCIGCTTGEWVEKYIGVTSSALGETVRVRFTQSSGTTEVDWAGTQWVSFQEWSAPGTTAVKSQPKPDLEQSQFMELRGTMRSGNFTLMENRVTFQYAFPLSGGTSLTVRLRRASNDDILASKIIEDDDPTSWDTVVFSWSQDYVGEEVYLWFSDTATQPSWIDNVGGSLVAVASVFQHPSGKAGDPFDTSTGQFIHSHTDVLIPGKGMPLAFTRTYQSMAGRYGDLGHNWRHSYSTSLHVHDDDSVTVDYASGGAAYFEHDNGSYTPPPGVHDTLVKTSTTRTH